VHDPELRLPAGSGVKLTILGSAAAWSERPARPSSSYLVELGDEAVVLDLGQGSFGSLAARREPSSVRAILISHMHPDHHVDLVPLRHHLRYQFEEPRSIGLHVPDELRRRYDAFLGEEDFLGGLVGPELVAGSRDIGPFVVQVHPVTHSVHSFAFRVTDRAALSGPGLVYSGDCGHADDLLPLIHRGDTVLCEAFWSTRTPDPGAQHLTATQAADVALRGGAARLILTHILDAHDPAAALDAARRVFGENVALAEPGVSEMIGGLA
jgi:ribonuclease BN (tRNA processing enzyme)